MIELTIYTTGTKIHVFIDKIVYLEPTNSIVRVYLSGKDNGLAVKESITEIKKLINTYKKQNIPTIQINRKYTGYED